MKTRTLLFATAGLFGFVGSGATLSTPDGGDRVRAPLRAADFSFARVQFSSFPQRGRIPGWAHDYPRADRNLLTILGDVSTIRTTSESYAIVQLEDPAIMRYPLLYFSEPGTWDITPREAENFREFLGRGGFAVFDDFDGPRDWYNFRRCINLVLPGREIRKLTVDHHVFHCFYDIRTLNMVPPYQMDGDPTFYGIFDEKERLQAVVNFNNDIGEFWEWSDEALFPVGPSNEAFKFGVNYVMYALTH